MPKSYTPLNLPTPLVEELKIWRMAFSSAYGKTMSYGEILRGMLDSLEDSEPGVVMELERILTMHQAPREIKGFRLFDAVTYNSLPAYVHGRRSTGYFVVKDFEGNTLSSSVSYKSLGLERHSGPFLFNSKKRNNGSIPPPSEDGSILEHLS